MYVDNTVIQRKYTSHYFAQNLKIADFLGLFRYLIYSNIIFNINITVSINMVIFKYFGECVCIMNVVETLARADELVVLGQTRLAYETYMEVVKAYKKNKCPLSREVLIAYNNAIVLAFEFVSDKDELHNLKNLAEDFVKVCRKTNESELYPVACYFAGVLCNIVGEYKKAVKYLRDALEVFELLGDEESVMLVCKQLAEAYKHLNYTEKARAYEIRASGIAKMMGGKDAFKKIEKFFERLKQTPFVLKNK